MYLWFRFNHERKDYTFTVTCINCGPIASFYLTQPFVSISIISVVYFVHDHGCKVCGTGNFVSLLLKKENSLEAYIVVQNVSNSFGVENMILLD